MSEQTGLRARTKSSENEKASIRALKNWLLAGPCDNPLEDQIVRLRLASAIAMLSAAQHHGSKGPKGRHRSGGKPR